MTSFTFAYTGAAQTWTVPAGATQVQIECWGASGAGPGGKGGYQAAWYPVTPGETLQVNVGGAGALGPSGAGGWNGGGRGGAVGASFGGGSGPGGGGASDVRRGGSALTNRILTAGGGGGNGDAGGGVTQNATYSTHSGTYNQGGTGIFGGEPGTFGKGGHGQDGTAFSMGGGGGGYYGGGGGGSSADGSIGYSGGGGGASYWVPVSGISNIVATPGVRTGDGQVIITLLSPNAPTLNTPATNTVLQAANVNRFTWTFATPVSGDTQSAFDMQWRVVGGSWSAPIHGATPNQFVDVPAGTFQTPGSYEWQVRTYESQGVVGPWSSSGFFTIATPVPGPSITGPVSGTIVAVPATVITWSAADQVAYQLRRVADSAGAANTAVVYSTTGIVNDTAARSATITFDTNNRTEHVELAVQAASGLWSPWSDISVGVQFTPPPVPSVNITVADSTTASITIGISNPTPTGGQPAVVTMDVFRSEGSGSLERVAAGLAVASSFTYWAPASGVDYAFMVRVYAANGTSNDSSTVSHVITAPVAGRPRGFKGGLLSGI